MSIEKLRIIPGGFPDPSICRVGDTWYLANSSFEYFPGIPIHQSVDLVNWELVGYGLHRPEQVSGAVNLVDVKSDDGIQAPSLRYHNGTFYLITTCVYRPPGVTEGGCTNFILTAADVRGPWSEPHVIEGAPGIDPDIFFDEDGKVWYVGTTAPDKPDFGGQGELYVHELDLSSWRLTGERHPLWRGALYCGVFVEGPHMYKHEGMYYLMAAEGGTGVNHSVVIASSDKVTGPFYPNERNPILTSRHLSYDNWVHSTGHADLFQLPDGRWYMVLLGVRAEEGVPGMRRSNMGRETHLVPVTWEREPMEWCPLGPPRKNLWPVAAPDTGRVERRTALPLGIQQRQAYNSFRDDFDSTSLNLEWNFRRVPREKTYSLTARPGFLRMHAQPEVIKENVSCSLAGIRQRHSEFTYLAKMAFAPAGDGVEGGVSLFQKDDSYVNFTVSLNDCNFTVRLLIVEKDKDARLAASEPLPSFAREITFKVESKDHGYHFSYSVDDGVSFRLLAQTASDLILGFGYTGSYLGLYCSSNGKPPQEGDHADFDWVAHQAFPRQGLDLQSLNRDIYHFVACGSKTLTLEVAMQIHPTLCYIGDDVAQQKLTLNGIVDQICDVIVSRNHDYGLHAGVIMVSDDFFEQLVEMRELRDHMHRLRSERPAEIRSEEMARQHLPEDLGKFFELLPADVRHALVFRNGVDGRPMLPAQEAE
ncbi:unnamed protein product, partial [Polarella glacialis]